MPRPSVSWRLFALCWALAVVVAGCSSGPAQWTFQPTPAQTAAGATGSPAGATGSPATACSADARVVKINETAALKMEPDSVDVTKGEKICFEATNLGGVTHNFHVGPATDIESRNKTDAVAGTSDFTSGTQVLEYTFSGDGPFEYACWIPGHLEAGMKGSINLR